MLAEEMRVRGRRQKRQFITVIVVVRGLRFSDSSLSHGPITRCEEGQVIPVHPGRVCYKTGTLSLGTWTFYNRQYACWPFVPELDIVSSKAVHRANIFIKIRTKAISTFAYKRYRNVRDLWKILSRHATTQQPCHLVPQFLHLPNGDDIHLAHGGRGKIEIFLLQNRHSGNVNYFLSHCLPLQQKDSLMKTLFHHIVPILIRIH